MKKIALSALTFVVGVSVASPVFAQGDSGFECGRGCTAATTPSTTPTTTIAPATTTNPPNTTTTGPTVTTIPVTDTTVKPVAPEQSNVTGPEQQTVGTTPANPAAPEQTTNGGNARPTNTGNTAATSAEQNTLGSNPAVAPAAPTAPETARMYESEILTQYRPTVSVAPAVPVQSQGASLQWMYLALAGVAAGACAAVAAKVRSGRSGMVFSGDIPDGVFVAAIAESDSEEEKEGELV